MQERDEITNTERERERERETQHSCVIDIKEQVQIITEAKQLKTSCTKLLLTEAVQCNGRIH